MPKLEDTIEALDQGGNVTLNGQLFQEDEDSLTIQVGSALIDIPKKYILTRRDVDARAGTKEAKIVDVTISRDARVIQRVPVTASAIPGLAAGLRPGDVSACACACECNCACDCACGSSQEMAQFLRSMAFRNPMVARSARRA